MFYQTTQEITALAAFRADRKLREELTKDLYDFRAIFWDPATPQQKAWASLMVQSIEHELSELDNYN